MKENFLTPEYTEFLEVLKEKVATARYKAARTINHNLILLYHYIGTEILKKQAA